MTSGGAGDVTPEQRLAGAFAAQVGRWASARGAPAEAVEAAVQAARLTSLATSEGHVCIDLSDLAFADSQATQGSTPARALLLASGVVGTPQAPASMPLILDDGDRLYLHRYFDYERRLARRLLEARRFHRGKDTGSGVRELLHELFAPNAARPGTDWQQVAAALALRGALTIVSGGPGTGKTTTVVNLLACLLARDPGCRIALAAPTGKAAARMTEAIRQRALHLPQPLRAALPANASTIHRLLGATRAGFDHDARNPLPIDALVVDEASMLDLSLATRLLEGVPPHASIVMLGDKDQLAAVEAGAVFAELSADPALHGACIDEIADLCGVDAATIRPPAALHATGLADSVVWLQENFRFAADSALGRLARAVNAGDGAGAVAALRESEKRAQASVRWLHEAAIASRALEESIDEGYAAYLDALCTNCGDVAAVHEAFGRFRVLCAMRSGPRGVEAINEAAARRFRRRLPSAMDSGSSPDWFPGRPIIVLRNDHALKLFNGDVGIALPDAGGRLTATFIDAHGALRSIAPVRLPEHETAFAMTVHKAQGSEFDEALVVLPSEPTRVLTRELIYTALTRARQRICIAAPEAVLRAGIDTPTRRRSGLAARIEEAAKAQGRGQPMHASC